MRILLLVSIFLSFISTQAMQQHKNRGCSNQVIAALACFLQYAGQESLHRYGHYVPHHINYDDVYVKENVLYYAYVHSSTHESLAQQAKTLCLQKRGLHFLRSSNIFAAAISKESSINMQAIIKGLEQKYGARVISSADNDGYFFQGILDYSCSELKENLQHWMN